MDQIFVARAAPPPAFSPLVLSDRLIALAQAADDAGFLGAARELVSLAYSVLDAPPAKRCKRRH